MRILQIRGRNLASLAGEFNLDFEHGPLADTGLFAISGPTGAGKSTLLDALCLALYNRTPRLDTRSTYDILDGPEAPIGVNDTRNILRRGTAEGFAEVRFVGTDGHRYRATWSVQRARKRIGGKLQKAEIELQDEETGVPIGRNASEVLAATERVIGLTFEQFRRSTLLAQGDFAAFLRAKGDERSELLERMTGTALYSAISARAFAKARQIEEALRQQESEANALILLSDEDRGQLEQQITDLDQQVQHVAIQLTTLRDQKAWWNKYHELTNKLRESQESHKASERRWTDAAARRQTLTDIEQVQPLRPLQIEAVRAAVARTAAEVQLTTATEAAQQARALAALKATALQDALNALNAHKATAETLKPDIATARALDHSIAEKTLAVKTAKTRRDAAQATIDEFKAAVTRLEDQHTSKSTELTQLQVWLNAHPHVVSLAQSWSHGVLPQLQTFQRKLTSWNAKNSALPGLTRAHERTHTAFETVQHAYDAAAQATATAATKVRQAEDAEKSHPANAFGDRRTALDALRGKITMLEALRQQSQTAEQELTDRQTRIEATKTNAANGKSRAEQSVAALQEVEQQLQDNRRLLDQLGLDALRAKLVEGDPCPLCGSAHHPGVGPLHETTATLTAQKKRLEKRAMELQAQKSDGEALQSSSTDRVNELQAEVEQRQRALVTAKNQWHAQGGEGEPQSRTAGDWLRGQVTQRNNEEDAIQQLDQALAQLRGSSATARQAHQDAGTKEQQALTALNAARTATAQAKETLDKANAGVASDRTVLDGTLATLAPAFTGMGGWQTELEADPAMFITDWSVRIKEAEQNVVNHTSATDSLEAIQRQQGLQFNNLEQATQTFTDRDAEYSRLDSDLTTLRTQRAPLLQGRSVAEVETEMATTQEKVESDHNSAVNLESTARADAAAKDAARNSAQVGMDQATQADTTASQKLNAALLSAGLDKTTLKDRLSRDDAWIARERIDLEAIDRQRSSDEKTFNTRTAEFQDHSNTPAPEQPSDAIVSTLAEQELQQGSLNQQLGAARSRLAHDDEKRSFGARKDKELADARVQARIWQQLNELIGSADGKKFRQFAQSLTMELLLALTNAELKTLAPRYSLQRVKAQDLELQVIDRDMGDEVRSTSSLSGGETFLVSLALALGLSSLASEKVRIESLFVDEGFGTLDAETLEVALATLDSLQAAGRKVGLISHVPGLAERIGVQVLVERLGAGASSVRVTNGLA